MVHGGFGLRRVPLMVLVRGRLAIRMRLWRCRSVPVYSIGVVAGTHAIPGLGVYRPHGPHGRYDGEWHKPAAADLRLLRPPQPYSTKHLHAMGGYGEVEAPQTTHGWLMLYTW